MDIMKAIGVVKHKSPFPSHMDIAPEPYLEIARVAQALLPAGSRVLDFGCGSCDKVAVLQLIGFACYATDDLLDDWHSRSGSREMIERFASELGITFAVTADRQIPFGDTEFDMVMLHGVIEHLHESPRELLIALLERVRNNGLLFVTVPNAVNIRKRLSVMMGGSNYYDFEGFYWYPGSWRGHVREYVRRDLELMCQFLGVSVVQLRGVDFMLWKLPSWAVPLYTIATALGDGLKDTWLLVAKKPSGWQPRRAIDAIELDRILGRFSRS